MRNPAEPWETITPLECYQIFRSRIEHEDNLVMQRLSWLMASQSFLFTAYAIVTNSLGSAIGSNSAAIYVRRLSALERIVPIVALLNSLLILVSILAALKAIRELRHEYRHRSEHSGAFTLQPNRVTRVLGFAAPAVLPILFLAVWFYLLVR